MFIDVEGLLCGRSIGMVVWFVGCPRDIIISDGVASMASFFSRACGSCRSSGVYSLWRSRPALSEGGSVNQCWDPSYRVVLLGTTQAVLNPLCLPPLPAFSSLIVARAGWREARATTRKAAARLLTLPYSLTQIQAATVCSSEDEVQQ